LVAADPGARIAGEYKSQLQYNSQIVTDRKSCVIAPNGKILLRYTERNPE